MGQAMQTGTERGRRNGAMRNVLRSRTGDVLDDFAELRRDVSRLAQAATKAAREEVESARQRLQLMGRDISNRARGGATFVGDKVRQHPAAAIGVTLGAGLLIGLLLSRARR